MEWVDIDALFMSGYTISPSLLSVLFFLITPSVDTRDELIANWHGQFVIRNNFKYSITERWKMLALCIEAVGYHRENVCNI
jgi:hypothetical protein